MAFLFFILISLLAMSTQSEARQEVRNNVHIVESKWTSDPPGTPEELVLICNTSEDTSVYWTKDQKWRGNGPRLEITVSEPLDAGNYICWSNATHMRLSSTTVYILKRDTNGEIAEPILSSLTEGNIRTYFKCIANNYSGNFKCLWKPVSENADLKFEIRAETESKAKSSDNTSGNIICGQPMKNPAMYSVSCRKENSCPLTEEYHPTKMVLEVFYGVIYEKHTHTFFIKDIIQPDISKCQLGKNGQLTLIPPQTWSTPFTYFGLTYQIKVIRRRNTGREPDVFEVNPAALLQNGNILRYHHLACILGTCCVRSRDHYHKHSAWSNWSACSSTDSRKHGKANHEDKTKLDQCNN